MRYQVPSLVCLGRAVDCVLASGGIYKNPAGGDTQTTWGYCPAEVDD
jgi:hypothetical protein